MRIRTHDLCDQAIAVLYQLSYQANCKLACSAGVLLGRVNVTTLRPPY